MKIKKVFNKSILKINNNDILFINSKHKLNAMLQILQDNKKQFSIKKSKYLIINDKINKCIKNYYNNLI